MAYTHHDHITVLCERRMVNHGYAKGKDSETMESCDLCEVVELSIRSRTPRNDMTLQTSAVVFLNAFGYIIVA